MARRGISLTRGSKNDTTAPPFIAKLSAYTRFLITMTDATLIALSWGFGWLFGYVIGYIYGVWKCKS